MEKKRKLELTLAALLPYNLEFYDSNIKEKSVLFKIDYNENTHSCFSEDKTEVYDSDGYDFKPLLHSMDKLTEPILEGGLIPIVELAKINDFDLTIQDYKLRNVGSVSGIKYFDGNQDVVFTYSTETNSFVFNTLENPKEIFFTNSQLQLFEKLKEWHFNIYDLPKEMYIEKSEIK